MYEFIKNDRFTKILLNLAFIFIATSLIIITKTPPAKGYELSIYDAYPWYFWFLIIMAIFIGQLILIKNAIFSNKNDKFWIFGFLVILISDIVLLFMPFIRGYSTFGRWDELTHIGHGIDIIKTGHIGELNFYPMDHILVVTLHYMVGAPVNYIINAIASIFSLFYIISFYLLVKQIFERKDEVLFVLAFTSILLISHEHLTFAPSAQSFFLLPFVLYLYFKSRDLTHALEFNFLLIISLFLIVFFHPMTTLFLILVFLILEFCLFIRKNINKTQGFELPKLPKRGSLNVISISFITFFIWYFSFSAIVNSFRSVLNWLLYESGRPEVKIYSKLIARAHPELSDLLKVIFHTYGQILILGFLSLIFSIYFFKIWKGNKNKAKQGLKFYHIFFSIGSLVFIVLSVIFFFNDFIIGFGRVSKYTLFFSSVLVGLGFYNLIKRSELSFNRRCFGSILLCIVLISLLYFSTFNLYWSPIVKKENQQVSNAEIEGMRWFFDYRDRNLLIQELGLSQKRFHDAIYGIEVSKKNIRYGINAHPPDHFDYGNKTLLDNSYGKSCYLLVSYLGRIIYPEIYPEYEKFWRFTPNDFKVLESDITISKIYNNRNLNVYLKFQQN